MKKVFFAGILAVGLLFSVNSVAQEDMRSNQLEQDFKKFEEKNQNNFQKTAHGIQSQYERTRSDIQNIPDTLRNEFNRTRSDIRHSGDTIRKEYDRARKDYKQDMDHERMKRDSMNRQNKTRPRNP